MKIRRRMMLVVLLVVTLVAAACGGGDDDEATTTTEQDGGSARGATVTVLSLWGGSEQEAFQKVLDAFTAKTGIKTQYETARDFQPVIRSRLAAGNPPMVAIVPRPGIVASLAKDGDLKSLEDLGLDPDEISDDYGKAWTDLATVDGDLYGIVVKANSKSVVWYRPPTFQQLGIQIPKKWTELLAAADKIAAAGKTPWALGAKDSWTLTDWFENIYVRQAGPDKYSDLFSGELKFTDESVKRALQEMTKVLNDKTVAGGIQGALGTDFVSGIGTVFAKNSAELYMEGGFVAGIALGQVNTNLKPNEDIAFFPFPEIEEKHGNPLVGGGDVAVAFVDKPGVKELMSFLASKEAGDLWAGTGAIVSPNKTVDVNAYPNELVKAEAEQVKAAETFRFDGSDLLPGTLAETWGNTLQGVLQDPGKIDQLLSDFQRDAETEFDQ